MTELSMPFVLQFVVNFLSVSLLCYGCYYRINKNHNVAGSFLLFGVGIFLITYLLHGVDMSMEFAFGLFAVFTMLRYRTETLSIKEMTYLFLVTAMAMLSAVSQLSLHELLLINVALCGCAFLVETRLFKGRLQMQRIAYEKIDNIKPHNRALLLADLSERTGLQVVSVEIEQIDFMRDMAHLIAYYLPKETECSVLDAEPQGQLEGRS